MRLLVLLTLAVLGAARATAAPQIAASASVLWTRNQPAMEHKVYGYIGPFDLGISLRRGQLRRTTRLDARAGLRLDLEPWLTLRAAIQVGSLSPDPPCRTDCARWEDFELGYRSYVLFGRATVAADFRPSVDTSLQVVWQTPPIPNAVHYWAPESTPWWSLFILSATESSLFFEHRVMGSRERFDLSVITEARALGLFALLFGDDESYTVHVSAFGPRVGGGVSLGFRNSVFLDLSGGTSIAGGYGILGVRLGRQRDHILW